VAANPLDQIVYGKGKEMNYLSIVLIYIAGCGISFWIGRKHQVQKINEERQARMKEFVKALPALVEQLNSQPCNCEKCTTK
jgi:flagellar basal body-associated protein FliL